MESIVGVVCCRVQSAGDRECHRSTLSPLTLHCLRAEHSSFLLKSIIFIAHWSRCLTYLEYSNSYKYDKKSPNYAIYRNPRVLSSTLDMLRTLQPRALGFLNQVVPLVLASNYYVDSVDSVLDAPEVVKCFL